MERLRILAAALILREFRADELRAFSGANADTVRSVLRRDTDIFEVVSTESGGGPGRPANRYRVKDADHIRSEIRELELAVEPIGRRLRPEAEPDPAEERLVVVASAEDAILESWRSEEPGDRVLLARTALSALAAARRMMSEDVVPDDDPVRRRAADVEVFARIAHAESKGDAVDIEDLHQAAIALADLAEVAPERISSFLLGLSATAVRNHQLLPLALALSGDDRPPDSISVADGDVWVEAAPLAETGYVLWSQRWALPLAERELFAGAIVRDYGEQSFDAPLFRLMDWRAPMVVLSERHSPEVVGAVSALGAYFVPSSAGIDGITRTMVSAFKRTRIEDAGTAGISFDLDFLEHHQ